jgi:hypothetical protein
MVEAVLVAAVRHQVGRGRDRSAIELADEMPSMNRGSQRASSRNSDLADLESRLPRMEKCRELARVPAAGLARTLCGMVAAERRHWPQGWGEPADDAVRDYFYRGEIARKIGAFTGWE